MRSDLAVTCCVVALSACADDPTPPGILGKLASRGYWTEVIPPINSGCGKVQPGYDPGDPEADPPIPPSLDGQPYHPEDDPFCTAAWTRRFTHDGSQALLEECLYVAAIGEPDPDADVKAWHHDRAFECCLRHSVDAEPVDSFPIDDIQYLTLTLVEVQDRVGEDGFCAQHFTPGDQEYAYLYRSTNPAVMLHKEPARADQEPNPEPDYMFQGLVGMEETGGASHLEGEGGFTQYERACDPVPVDCEGGEGNCGPGICDGPGACRTYSASTDDLALLECTWEDVRALPANADLIDPDWRADHADLMREVFGHL